MRIHIRHKRKSKKFILILFIPILAFIAFICMIRPVVLTYAENIVQQTASYAIHDLLMQEVYENQEQYAELVTLERDNENQITALKTNTILADYLKIQLARTTYDALNTLEQGNMDMPLGSVFFPTLFAGKGPNIHVGIASLGYANADFISAFTSAGINQTRHQILLDVQAEAQILTFLGVRDVEISTQIAVTDTVIVGTVPDSYTYIDDTEQSLLGKINDYSHDLS